MSFFNATDREYREQQEWCGRVVVGAFTTIAVGVLLTATCAVCYHCPRTVAGVLFVLLLAVLQRASKVSQRKAQAPRHVEPPRPIFRESDFEAWRKKRA